MHGPKSSTPSSFDDAASSTNSSDFSVGRGGSAFPSNAQEQAFRGSARLSTPIATRKPSTTTAEVAAVNRLSELTVNKLQFAKLDRLYGRGPECLQLQAAWDSIRRTARGTDESANRSQPTVRRCLVTVRGASGTGKSALAESLRSRVLREGGFYLHGKFPQPPPRLSRQQHAAEPYAAFTAACGDLAAHLVTEDGAEGPGYRDFALPEFRERLEHDVGADAVVLMRVIPSLLPLFLIPELITPPEVLNGLEARNRFNDAFRRFLRAVSAFGPVVLVLDDVQWADSASMELLEALLSNRESGALLCVACYRDDGDNCSAGAPHTTTIERIAAASSQDSGLQVDVVSVSNLSVDQINELLVDLLSSTEAETLGLAECAYRKTLGNVFFVIQFLTVLQDVGLLVYNIGALKWTWDLDAIQLKMAATDNVVNLMKEKMSQLPASISRVLPMMACLGTTLSMPAFKVVVDHLSVSWDWSGESTLRVADLRSTEPQNESFAVQLATLCEYEGLIERCDADSDQSFIWVHDKIQEAAYSMISEDELQTLKLQLGKILYEGLQPVDLERQLFIVANLLNAESKDESSLPVQKPIEIARFFLRAGMKAIETSAFQLAADYLTAGIDLLPADHWECEYGLSLDLYSTAAEAEYCAGNFDGLRYHCQRVIQQEHRPHLDKQRVYNVLVDATAAGEGPSEAIALCLSIMSSLGCDFPRQTQRWHIHRAFAQLKRTLQKFSSVDIILNLPVMEDRSKLWIVSLLDRIVTYAYLCKSEHLPLFILRWLQLAIDGGASSNTPVVFVMGGFAIAAYLEDYQSGVALAELSLELVRFMKSPRKVESRVVEICHSVVLHWLRPIKLLVKPLVANYSLSMAVGDTEMAGWGIYFCLEYSLLTGMCLQDLKSDLKFYVEQLRRVKQLGPVEVIQCIWQSVLHLTDENPFDDCLGGDIMQQKLVVQDQQKLFEHLRAVIMQYQLYTAFLFGKYSLVCDTLRNTNADKAYFDRAFHGLNALCQVYATCGLSLVSRFRETNDKKYLKLAKKFAYKIKSWALASNPNVTHFDYLLEGEFESLRGHDYGACKHYEAAVVYAGRRGLTQDRALAHERYGEHLLRLGDASRAPDGEFQLREATKLYEEWGARAKVKQLREAHPRIVVPIVEMGVPAL